MDHPKLRNIKLYGTDFKVAFQLETYKDKKGAPAIVMFSLGADGVEPFGKVSVNIPEHPPVEGATWLKDWGENEPFVPDLLKEGYLVPTGRTCQTGYTVAKEVKITDKFKAIFMTDAEIQEALEITPEL